MNEVKINNYFRFYKWPTKAKRDNKKSILNIISPSVAIQIFSRSLHPYLCLPDVLHSLSQVLLVTLSESFHQAHILISQLLEMLAADVHAWRDTSLMSEVVLNQDHVVSSPRRSSQFKKSGSGEHFWQSAWSFSYIPFLFGLQPPNLRESYGLFLKQKQPWSPVSQGSRASLPIIQVSPWSRMQPENLVSRKLESRKGEERLFFMLIVGQMM